MITIMLQEAFMQVGMVRELYNKLRISVTVIVAKRLVWYD